LWFHHCCCGTPLLCAEPGSCQFMRSSPPGTWGVGRCWRTLLMARLGPAAGSALFGSAQFRWCAANLIASAWARGRRCGSGCAGLRVNKSGCWSLRCGGLVGYCCSGDAAPDRRDLNPGRWSRRPGPPVDEPAVDRSSQQWAWRTLDQPRPRESSRRVSWSARSADPQCLRRRRPLHRRSITARLPDDRLR